MAPSAIYWREKPIQDAHMEWMIIIHDEESEDVWNETVRLRTKNKIRSRATGNVYIFRGLLTCKHCGHMMTGAYSKRSKDFMVQVLHISM